MRLREQVGRFEHLIVGEVIHESEGEDEYDYESDTDSDSNEGFMLFD